MKELRIEAPGHDLAQLSDELFAAFPGWRRAVSPGIYETDVRVESEGVAVSLSVPDDADEAHVREVVAAHVPPSAADVVAALAQMNLDGVTTVSDLKEAIAPVLAVAVSVVQAGAEGTHGPAESAEESSGPRVE